MDENGMRATQEQIEETKEYVLQLWKERELKRMREKRDNIEKTSMVQDHSDAYIYNARFDNDFQTDYFDEF